MHILVVEDEKKVASFIKRGLEAANYSVDVEYDGEAGLNRLLKHEYDLIILDVMLPKLDGLSLMKEIRQRRGGVPILFFTPPVNGAGKVMGFCLWAGGFIPQAFCVRRTAGSRARAVAPRACSCAGRTCRRGSAARPGNPRSDAQKQADRLDAEGIRVARVPAAPARSSSQPRCDRAARVGRQLRYFYECDRRLRELSTEENRRGLRAQTDPHRARRRLRAEGRAVGVMNWPFPTLRSRLTLWYTAVLTAMLALLGATSVMMLDHGLRSNLDDSLRSVARAIAES